MVIAEESLVARRAGNEQPLVIRVHQPEPDKQSENDTTYQTLLELDGFEKPIQVFGEGSLQSLSLAFGLLQSRLESISSQGWTLFHRGEDEQLEPHLNLFMSPRK